MNFGFHPIAMGIYLATVVVFGFVIYQIWKRLRRRGSDPSVSTSDETPARA